MAEPILRSFIPVEPDSHFPIQNLPYGVFKRRGATDARPTIGVAIGDQVLDLSILEERDLLALKSLNGRQAFAEPTLNAFMAAGRKAWREARQILTMLLRDDEPTLRDNAKLREAALVPMSDVDMLLPAHI